MLQVNAKSQKNTHAVNEYIIRYYEEGREHNIKNYFTGQDIAHFKYKISNQS